jgi:YfiH family protein
VTRGPATPRPPAGGPVLDAGLGVRAFFTTRLGGVSASPYDSFNLGRHVGDDAAAVDANRARLADLAGAPVAYMSQVHGARVVVVSSANDAPEADGIVARPGTAAALALAVLVADCVPLLLHDGATGSVAAVHVGRAGLAAGVVARAVEALAPDAAARGRVAASLGPAICGGCYELPQPLADEVAAVAPGARSRTTWGTPSIDLRAGVVAQLAAVGVVDARIVGGCTRESHDLFSHRREGVTGRIAGVVVCASDGAPSTRVAAARAARADLS